jgi:serine/threonine-protein kinase HipA
VSRCPLTYQPADSGKYTLAGLRNLSRNLNRLDSFPYTAAQQRYEASQRAAKISIQGMQPKLSARLSPAAHNFEIVDRSGTWIVKPQHHVFPQLPENEDLTMKMARAAGLQVPLHGLIYCADDSLSYVIRRFDRPRRGLKLALEDFAQLTGKSRKTKYRSTMESLVPVLDEFCTFPQLEKLKLFRLTLFCFVTGNEDMHLKNFSLLTSDGKVELSPAYDLLNTTIALSAAQEEVALPLSGKKSRLSKAHWLEYWAHERLGLTDRSVQSVLAQFQQASPHWSHLLNSSFLSPELRRAYIALLRKRLALLGMD